MSEPPKIPYQNLRPVPVDYSATYSMPRQAGDLLGFGNLHVRHTHAPIDTCRL